MAFQLSSLATNSVAQHAQLQLQDLSDPFVTLLNLHFPFTPDPAATQADTEAAVRARARALLEEALVAL